MTTSLPPLILASTSKYKIDQFQKFGIPFIARPHQYEEAKLKDEGLAPATLAEGLAKAKSLSLSQHHSDAWIIGADQVCSIEKEILEKPGSPEKALQQLSRLQGNTHFLHTAIAIGKENQIFHTEVVEAQLTMRSLSPAQIQQYLDTDKPYDCCGSYKIEENGIRLFREIQCPDFTAITGLPLLSLGKCLEKLGYLP